MSDFICEHLRHFRGDQSIAKPAVRIGLVCAVGTAAPQRTTGAATRASVGWRDVERYGTGFYKLLLGRHQSVSDDFKVR
jgi:hypothetical protein